MLFRFCCVFAFFLLQWIRIQADCGVVSRQEWDAVPSSHVVYLARPLDLVIIQHTVTATCTTDDSCASIVRSIQTIHMNKFFDIGPSFLVGGNGKVYEGAGWLHRGAHTYNYNGRSIGVSFIGNFNNDQPTSEMLNAAKALLRCGKENRHLTKNFHVVGHKQLIPTESPGRKLYTEIKGWPEWLEDAKTITQS